MSSRRDKMRPRLDALWEERRQRHRARRHEEGSDRIPMGVPDTYFKLVCWACRVPRYVGVCLAPRTFECANCGGRLMVDAKHQSVAPMRWCRKCGHTEADPSDLCRHCGEPFATTH